MKAIEFKQTVKKHFDFETMSERYGLKIPVKLTRSHLTSDLLGSNGSIGKYTNSNMLEPVLVRALRTLNLKPGAVLFLDSLPECVTVTGDFMKTVAINLSGLD